MKTMENAQPTGAKAAASAGMDPALMAMTLSRVFGVALVVGFLVSVLKGFRLPGSWAVTQLAVNYSQGFVRRGLVGELIRLVGGGEAYSYNVLLAISLLVFIGAAVGTGFMVRRILGQCAPCPCYRAAAFVFAASPAVVLFANLIGYLDILGYALTVPFLLYASMRRPAPTPGFFKKLGVFYVAALMAAGFPLIHETFLVVFLPIIVLALLCYTVRWSASRPFRTWEWAVIGGHLVGVVGVFLAASALVTRYGTLSVTGAGSLEQMIAAAANFELHGGVFPALHRNPRENLFSLMPPFFENPRYVGRMAMVFVSMLPGFGFLLLYGVSLAIRLKGALWARLLLCAAFLGVGVAPLTLNLVGWDVQRWNALAVLSSFAGVSTLCLFFSSPLGDVTFRAPRRLGLWLGFGIVAAVLGLAGAAPLFDGEMVALYPFEQDMVFLIHWVQSGFSYVPQIPR